MARDKAPGTSPLIDTGSLDFVPGVCRLRNTVPPHMSPITEGSHTRARPRPFHRREHEISRRPDPAPVHKLDLPYTKQPSGLGNSSGGARTVCVDELVHIRYQFGALTRRLWRVCI